MNQAVKFIHLYNKVLDNDFDFVTLFYVFEHLKQPINELKTLKKKMKKGVKIIIEVPHAKDFLLSFLNLESFKEFTFWSEQLILQTRESLKIFLNKAGFSKIIIKSFQRYPFSNHLYWLKEKNLVDTFYGTILAIINLILHIVICYQN